MTKTDAENKATEVAETEEKSTELALPDNFNELVEEKAKEIAHRYKEQSADMKLFNEKKAQISFYKEGGALPESDSIAQLMIKEQMGRQIGLSFMESMTGLGFVNGRVAIYGEVMLSQLVKQGVQIKFDSSDDKECTATITYKGQTVTETTTIDFWIKNGIVPKEGSKGFFTSPWTKYRPTMLKYKIVRQITKFLCPHLLGALPIMEDSREVMQTQKIDDSNATDVLGDIVGELEKE